MKLFLDCDGVLADFDALATDIFGMHPRRYEKEFGSKMFWKTLARYEDFYYKLPLMSDAMYLWQSVKHLNPTILTGCPRGGWAEDQKQRWAVKMFGSDVKMITCMSRDKRLHMQEVTHNIIIDDFSKYKSLWEEYGGTFILHTSAEESLKQLESLGVYTQKERRFRAPLS